MKTQKWHNDDNKIENYWQPEVNMNLSTKSYLHNKIPNIYKHLKINFNLKIINMICD